MLVFPSSTILLTQIQNAKKPQNTRLKNVANELFDMLKKQKPESISVSFCVSLTTHTSYTVSSWLFIHPSISLPLCLSFLLCKQSSDLRIASCIINTACLVHMGSQASALAFLTHAHKYTSMADSSDITRLVTQSQLQTPRCFPSPLSPRVYIHQWLLYVPYQKCLHTSQINYHSIIPINGPIIYCGAGAWCTTGPVCWNVTLYCCLKSRSLKLWVMFKQQNEQTSSKGWWTWLKGKKKKKKKSIFFIKIRLPLWLTTYLSRCTPPLTLELDQLQPPMTLIWLTGRANGWIHIDRMFCNTLVHVIYIPVF